MSDETIDDLPRDNFPTAECHGLQRYEQSGSIPSPGSFNLEMQMATTLRAFRGLER